MPPKKGAAQLEREIAEALQAKSVLDLTRGSFSWAVAADALREHRPADAAFIVKSIREERGALSAPEPFKRALRAVPVSVRERFMQQLAGPLDELRQLSVMGSIENPGYFSNPSNAYHYYKKSPIFHRYMEMPRKKLLDLVLKLYKDTGLHGEIAAHWQAEGKKGLAMIVADAYGAAT
jgi:hypothetical protein